jgi:hypothetical protein
MVDIIELISKYKVHILIAIIAVLAVSVVVLSTQSQKVVPISSNSKTAAAKNVSLPATLTDIDVYAQSSVIRVSGKITFSKDYSYQVLAAKIHLNDDSIVNCAAVNSWTDIVTGETYSFTGYLTGIGYGTDKALSDVTSVDFTVNGKTIGVWKND